MILVVSIVARPLDWMGDWMIIFTLNEGFIEENLMN